MISKQSQIQSAPPTNTDVLNTVDVSILSRICSNHLVEITSERECPIYAVSVDGLHQLMEKLGASGHRLDEVDLLQVAMTKDPRVEVSLKKQLLYGLLLPKGLTVIKEDGVIIAPSPEISLSCSVRGEVRFLEDFGRDISTMPPDLSDICHLKSASGLRVDQLLQFVLSKLSEIDPEESLLGEGSFRLKTYSSVINKLFFRGKKLKDLFATTVATDSALERLGTQLFEKGAIPYDEDDRLNGNGDLVYRYVRILQVELQGHPPFTLPVFYEIVRHSFETPVPHQQYELDRLRCSFNKGQKNLFNRMGLTIETY